MVKTNLSTQGVSLGFTLWSDLQLKNLDFVRAMADSTMRQAEILSVARDPQEAKSKKKKRYYYSIEDERLTVAFSQ